MKKIILAAAIAMAATPAMADAQSLQQDWARLNELCRGGAGIDPATDRTCVRREAVSRKLRALGCVYQTKDRPLDYWVCK